MNMTAPAKRCPVARVRVGLRIPPPSPSISISSAGPAVGVHGGSAMEMVSIPGRLPSILGHPARGLLLLSSAAPLVRTRVSPSPLPSAALCVENKRPGPVIVRYRVVANLWLNASALQSARPARVRRDAYQGTDRFPTTCAPCPLAHLWGRVALCAAAGTALEQTCPREVPILGEVGTCK